MTEIMAEPNPETKPETKPGLKRWRDILLLVFSLVSILILLGRAIYLAIIGFSSTGNQTTTGQSANFYGSVSMLFCVILLLPVVALSIRRLKGQTMKAAKVPPVKLWQVVALVGIWVVVIIFSSLSIKPFQLWLGGSGAFLSARGYHPYCWAAMDSYWWLAYGFMAQVVGDTWHWHDCGPNHSHNPGTPCCWGGLGTSQYSRGNQPGSSFHARTIEKPGH